MDIKIISERGRVMWASKTVTQHKIYMLNGMVMDLNFKCTAADLINVPL